MRGGAGDDEFVIVGPLNTSDLRGGRGGFDTFSLHDFTGVINIAAFHPAAWGFEYLELGGQLIGSDADDHWDFSGLIIDTEPFIVGMGGDDVMVGADDHFNRFYGMAGNDRLYGGNAMDEMTGGTGRNRLYGGGGDDNMLNIDIVSDGAGRTLVDGGDGNDMLFANNGAYRVYGGDGEDQIAFEDAVVRQDAVFGGNGIDTLLFSDGDRFFEGAVFDVDLFDAETSGIESLTGGTLAGSKRNNALDFSEFTLLTDFGVTVSGMNGDDYLAGTHGDDVLMGNAGNDIINSTAGMDALDGGAGNDILTGSLGHDALTGKGGSDTYVFLGVTDSTSTDYDAITDLNFADGDTIDLWFDVEVVRAPITAGALSTASFDADLAAAIGADELAGQQAVLFTPDEGSLAGLTFLIVDANNSNGYQPGQDLVMQIDGEALDDLSSGAFV
jgi:Ca2+-binding RTX toxin-like protein